MIHPSDTVWFVFARTRPLGHRPSVGVSFSRLHLIVPNKRGSVVILHAFVAFVVKYTMGFNGVWPRSFIHEHNFNDIANFSPDKRTKEPQMYFSVATLFLVLKCRICKLPVDNFLVNSTEETAVRTSVYVGVPVKTMAK